MEGGGKRSAEALAVLPGMGQSSTNSFTQNLAFELGEMTASSAAMARPAGVVRSRASVSETKPTPRCSSSWRVASRSATDLPQRSRRQTSTTSISLRRAASIIFSRICRCEAPEPTSLTCIVIVQPRLCCINHGRGGHSGPEAVG